MTVWLTEHKLITSILAKVILENKEDELIIIVFEKSKFEGDYGYFEAVQTTINQLID